MGRHITSVESSGLLCKSDSIEIGSMYDVRCRKREEMIFWSDDHGDDVGYFRVFVSDVFGKGIL